ncbi:hypothetical protein A9264_05560 [Vibrio sp. UCD-FRSSP16_10]|uniref:DUF333 domain-containing protein n=1 Tax=unclassified Vibrio TaxID=2614977 RepID=UPI0007FC242E|nr:MULTISPECIES: DUF333 domain-containing protein [unclassified Vibrio]OBT07936.1 hypothetical protein A9260_07800 [Vibrio sp. UCD-FRSSP16_30]OBT17111.1 hypothetical protein A9264_05560 [Vibrio sp. UCD-FRSSP16_10]
MKKILLLSIMASTVLLAGCASEPNEYTVKDWDPITSKASMYCVQENHDIERATENNQRVTYCEISDSEKYEIWEYYYQNHEDERPDAQNQADETKQP